MFFIFIFCMEKIYGTWLTWLITLCQVKEHLELFANLKGVNEASLDGVVTEMIDEVSSCHYLSSGSSFICL